MATSSRFENSASSPDNAGFGYANSHRSHYSTGGGGPNLERASSFRESHEGSGRAGTPGGAGSSFPNAGGAITHGELPPLSQVLSLEPIPTGEQRYLRQVDLRKATVAALALVEDVPPGGQQKPIEQQGPEELKRIKASLVDNATRARERSRTLSEAITKLDKYRAALLSRKRARVEALAHERPLSSVSGERPVPSNTASTTITPINPSKASFCASPSHGNMAEGSLPKPEDKNKGPVPNKRVRTSMLDVRLEGRASMPSFQRTSGLADRDRESMKLGSSLGGLADEKDRLVAPSGEVWEKTKTKGRRSTTKLESVITATAGGVSEIEREHKWGAQHRSNAENRPRSIEGHSFRSGPVHGVVSVQKSTIRNEPDNSIPAGEKEGRFGFPDKERPTPTLKGGSVKLSHKDEGSLLSPTTVAKAKAARAPRSSTGIPVNPAAAHALRPPSADLWDRTAAAAVPNRAQIPAGPSNRKRPAPTRSSSPPVAQWVGQRPQKMSRVARRMNIAPPVGPTGGVRDEAIPSAEGGPVREPSVMPTGVRSNPSTSPVAGLVKRVASTAALSQIKSKPERVASPAGLSESEDSEGADVKLKEKWKKHADSEGRFAPVNQKMAPLFSPGKKSRVGPKEEGGDGIRRQGRSGRALIAVRESSNVTLIEKGDASANAKQLRSARPGVDKMEKPVDVKPGRPPTKKGGIGDRKALTRPRRPAPNGGSEVSGESDDDREELVAAVQAAVNASATACSSMFWKEIEPFFAYLTPDARNTLKIQVKARELEDEELLPSLTSDSKAEKAQNTLDSTAAGKASYLANGTMDANGSTAFKGLNSKSDHITDGIKAGLNGGWPIVKELPLSQRLLAALIIEGDLDDDNREDRSQHELQGYAGDGSSHELSDSEQAGVEKDQDSESEADTRAGKLNGWVKSSSYDVSYTSNGHRHWDSESELLNSPVKSELRKEEEKHFSDINGLNKWDGRYQNLTLDERIALELQSIGLYPDQGELAVREDDQVAKELKNSQQKLKELVHENKERLSSLEEAVSNGRVIEERERERLAMTKLLENAFNKRLGVRGGHLGVSGSKNAASKAGGRAAAVTIAKRSLARWKHFEETGESCFTEAGLREILFCVSSKDGEVKALSNSGEVRVGINTVGLTLTGSSELKLAASAGTRWICRALGTEKVDKDSCESDQLAVGTPSERTGDKDDIWCTRSKEREVLLEDVGGSGSVGSVLCGTKGKRSERERDAGNVKGGGRQGLGTIKGERKTKTKPRQKTAPLLKAVNGLVGKPSELPEKPGARVKQESMGMGLVGVEAQPDNEGTIDLSHLQIPGMDELVANGDLGGQGQDLGSWLDFDDPGLPDAGGDFMGLDVPMDDLSDLAMMM
eukprot:c11393_g1_i1 orf=342-4457(-)